MIREEQPPGPNMGIAAQISGSKSLWNLLFYDLPSLWTGVKTECFLNFPYSLQVFKLLSLISLLHFSSKRI